MRQNDNTATTHAQRVQVQVVHITTNKIVRDTNKIADDANKIVRNTSKFVRKELRVQGIVRTDTHSPRVGPFRTILLAALQVGQVLLPLLRLPPDPPVEPAHDGHGHVEGGDGGAERNVVVGLYELDVALVVRHRALALDVRPRVDPGRPQQQRYPPGAA